MSSTAPADKNETEDLRRLLMQREMLRDQKMNAQDMFDNEEDDQENSHID
jgi:hypothetical protein